MRTRRLVLVGVVLALVGAACGGDARSESAASAPVTVRLGYFPNVTHATALVGVEKGLFAQALGPDRLETRTFNAGPAAIEALLSGALDATYIGPNPAINAFTRSKGEAIRIISGATSGGASFVVRPDINSPADLKGAKVASPQLGGTQDVALRAWLRSNGVSADVVPQENAQTLETFRAGTIAGAWVPEPWATRLVREGGGKVLVDEADLWPGGRFVTTHLIVRTAFLKEHPDTVRRLLEGQVAADAFVNANPAEAQAAANAAIEKATGKKLGAEIIEASWKHLTFTNDPVASSLTEAAANATEVGLLPKADLTGIYDLGPLNGVLRGRGLPEVAS